MAARASRAPTSESEVFSPMNSNTPEMQCVVHIARRPTPSSQMTQDFLRLRWNRRRLPLGRCKKCRWLTCQHSALLGCRSPAASKAFAPM